MDFFIWDPTSARRVLLAVQVTAQNPLKAHMAQCNFMHSEWCRFLDIQGTSLCAIWMAPLECIDVTEHVHNGLNNYVMDFNALSDLCPAIKEFKRCLKREPSLETAESKGAGDEFAVSCKGHHTSAWP